MIDELKKMIADDNEVLNILPQNNVNNRKKYRTQLASVKKKYVDKQDEILGYIVSKNKLLKNKYDIPYADSLSKQMRAQEEKTNYFNPYQDAYEILGLDKLFYGLHKYYDNDLNIYNNNINKILDIFNQVGLPLTSKDFYFSDSTEKYMDVLIKERSNGNYNSQVIKQTFEDLFWQNHNMMRYILLNFKHLYYNNEKKFAEYITKARKEILAEYENNFDNLLQKYQDLVIKSNNSYLSNRGVFYNKFISNELSTNDFTKEKVEKIISEYLENSNLKGDREIFEKLYASIDEEKFIYRNKFVLDEVDKLYKEKDTFKNLVATTKKEIASIEKSIYKKRKKINGKCLFKKKNSDSILTKEIEDSLQELDKKYDELDENRYKEKIASMVNPTIKDYLLLGKSYLFMEHISKEMEADTDALVSDIDKNIYCPYEVLVDNLNYVDVETLNLIVYDKYRLMGLNLTTDSFQEENLDGIAKVISNIIIYYTLQELDIKISEIDFIMQSDEIIKKCFNLDRKGKM